MSISSSEETSLFGLESVVERFVEWRGPVKNVDAEITSMCYKARGKNFYFLFVDKDDPSIGSIYQKPKVEKAPNYL